MVIDLNCDMGEGIGNDAAIMPYISSANIACGYHAGDEKTIWETIQLAQQHNVAIGAHISFLDKKNFGRSEMNLSNEEVYELVTQQLIIIESFTTDIHHVKPHGALYNMAAKDALLAKTIATAVQDFSSDLILYGLSNSHSITEAQKIGLKTASEVFADRAYMPDGSLMPRSQKGAVIEDADRAVAQVLQMIQTGKAETICVHGDNEKAIELVKRIHDTLKQKNIGIKTI